MPCFLFAFRRVGIAGMPQLGQQKRRGALYTKRSLDKTAGKVIST
jgi:hypothetical protein